MSAALLTKTFCQTVEGLHLYCHPRELSAVELLFSDNGMLFFSTLFGAIVGAVAGGIIQYWISVSQAEHSRKLAALQTDDARRLAKQDAERNRLAAEMTDAYRLTYKIQAILEIMADTIRAIESMIETAREQGAADMEIWLKVMPLVGLPKAGLELEAADFSALFGARQFELVGKVGLIARRWAVTLAHLQEYAQLRSEFVRDHPHFATYGLRQFKEDDEIEILARVDNMNKMISNALDTLKEDSKSGLKTAELLGDALRSYLQEPTFPKIGGVQPASSI